MKSYIQLKYKNAPLLSLKFYWAAWPILAIQIDCSHMDFFLHQSQFRSKRRNFSFWQRGGQFKLYS